MDKETEIKDICRRVEQIVINVLTKMPPAPEIEMIQPALDEYFDLLDKLYEKKVDRMEFGELIMPMLFYVFYFSEANKALLKRWLEGDELQKKYASAITYRPIFIGERGYDYMADSIIDLGFKPEFLLLSEGRIRMGKKKPTN